MRRTEQLQGPSLMKCEDVYGRTYRGELSQLEAAEGLYDHRLGRASARRGGRGQPDPGRARARAARHRADRGLLAGGPGAVRAHVRDLTEAPAAGAPAGRDQHHGRGQPLPRGGVPASTFVPFAGSARRGCRSEASQIADTETHGFRTG